MKIEEVIKQRRSHLNITQNDLAEFADVGISTIKDLERGKGNPSVSTLQKILEVLGLEMKIEVKSDWNR